MSTTDSINHKSLGQSIDRLIMSTQSANDIVRGIASCTRTTKNDFFMYYNLYSDIRQTPISLKLNRKAVLKATKNDFVYNNCKNIDLLIDTFDTLVSNVELLNNLANRSRDDGFGKNLIKYHYLQNDKNIYRLIILCTSEMNKVEHIDHEVLMKINHEVNVQRNKLIKVHVGIHTFISHENNNEHVYNKDNKEFNEVSDINNTNGDKKLIDYVNTL